MSLQIHHNFNTVGLCSNNQITPTSFKYNMKFHWLENLSSLSHNKTLIVRYRPIHNFYRGFALLWYWWIFPPTLNYSFVWHAQHNPTRQTFKSHLLIYTCFCFNGDFFTIQIVYILEVGIIIPSHTYYIHLRVEKEQSKTKTFTSRRRGQSKTRNCWTTCEG